MWDLPAEGVEICGYSRRAEMISLSLRSTFGLRTFAVDMAANQTD